MGSPEGERGVEANTESQAASGVRFGRWVFLGLVAHFGLTLVVTLYFASRRPVDNLDLGAWVLLLRDSVGWVLLAVGALLCWPRLQARHRLLRELAAYGMLFGLLVSHLAIFASLEDLQSRVLSLAPAVVAALGMGLATFRWRSRPGRLTLAFLTAIGAVLFFGSGGPDQAEFGLEAPGSLGVVRFSPSSSEQADGSKMLDRDNYPLMTFDYNRLGYRDLEPVETLAPGQQRVLIVGDSFVWGDGIATLEGTIGHQLRLGLEALAPGRYVVMSVHYPGTGLYGSLRMIQATTARYPASLVVIGYLGQSDFDPMDAQVLAESFPASALAWKLLFQLGIAQHFHEVSLTHADDFWYSDRNRAFMEGILATMRQEAAAADRKLLILDYMYPSPAPYPEGAEVLVLPKPLRYPGHSNAYWYEKNFHPKEKLNAWLGRELAKKILTLVPPDGFVPPSDAVPTPPSETESAPAAPGAPTD